LHLQGYPPTIAPDYIIGVDEAALILSGQLVYTAPTVLPSAAALTLSGKSVNINTALPFNIPVAEATLTFNGQSVTRGRGLLLTPHTPELILSTPQIPSTQLTLTTTIPNVVNTSAPPIAVPSTQLELTGNNLAWTVTQLPKISSLILEFPTMLVTDSSPTFFPAEAPLVLDPQDLVSDRDITPDTGALALTGYAPTLAIADEHTALPNHRALSLTGNAPNVFTEPAAFPEAATLTLNGQVPVVNTLLTVPAGSLELAGWWPIVVERDSYAIEVDEETLTLAGQAPVANVGPNITVPEATLQLTGAAPVVDVTHSGGPAAETLVLTGYAPVIDETVTLPVPVTALMLEGQAVTTVIHRIRNRSGGRKRLISRTIVTKLRHLRARH
jgi:hypothetical protein